MGFPAPELPPCAHYLFNHLFMILEKEELQDRVGRMTLSPRALNEQYSHRQLSVKSPASKAFVTN